MNTRYSRFRSTRYELQILKWMLGFNRQIVCWSLNNKRLLHERRAMLYFVGYDFCLELSDAHRSSFTRLIARAMLNR